MSNISQTTPFQNMLLGSIGATIECGLQHPLSIIKNSKQNNVPIKFNPRFLYRGLFIGGSSASVFTTLQFVSYSQTYKLFENKLSNNYNSLVSSIISGTFISFLIAPIETSIIQKCKYDNMNLNTIMKNNFNKYGYKFFCRGLTNTIMRESLFSIGLLSFTPYLEKKINTGNNVLNSICASTLSGVSSSILSHPFDTIKTKQQYHMYEKINYKEMFTIQKLFKGCFFRTFRNSTAFFILNESNKFFINYV